MIKKERMHRGFSILGREIFGWDFDVWYFAPVESVSQILTDTQKELLNKSSEAMKENRDEHKRMEKLSVEAA